MTEQLNGAFQDEFDDNDDYYFDCEAPDDPFDRCDLDDGLAAQNPVAAARAFD